MRLGFLASHNGSGMRAILAAIASGRIEATAALAISNNEGAPALEAARGAGLPALALNARLCGSAELCDAAMAAALNDHGVDLVVLSGFLRPLGRKTLARYRHRALNVHPALLPEFGGKGMFGMRVHEAVIAAGERESGATVHLVDAEYDEGPVVGQRAVPVKPGDTPQDLAARVMAAEAELIVEVVAGVALGRIDLDAIAMGTASGPR